MSVAPRAHRRSLAASVLSSTMRTPRRALSHRAYVRTGRMEPDELVGAEGHAIRSRVPSRTAKVVRRHDVAAPYPASYTHGCGSIPGGLFSVGACGTAAGAFATDLLRRMTNMPDSRTCHGWLTARGVRRACSPLTPYCWARGSLSQVFPNCNGTNIARRMAPDSTTRSIWRSSAARRRVPSTPAGAQVSSINRTTKHRTKEE